MRSEDRARRSGKQIVGDGDMSKNCFVENKQILFSVVAETIDVVDESAVGDGEGINDILLE